MDDYLTKPLDRDATGRNHRTASGGLEPERGQRRDDAPVDWEKLMAVTRRRPGVAQELVQLFIDSGDAALRDIRAALERGDMAAIGRAAHAFKGSSANIRAASVSAAAAPARGGGPRRGRR